MTLHLGQRVRFRDELLATYDMERSSVSGLTEGVVVPAIPAVAEDEVLVRWAPDVEGPEKVAVLERVGT